MQHVRQFRLEPAALVRGDGGVQVAVAHFLIELVQLRQQPFAQGQQLKMALAPHRRRGARRQAREIPGARRQH